jgi:peptide/nickel transport system permease protein
MHRYIIRRLLHIWLTAFLASVFLFLLLNLMQGDAIDIYFGLSEDRSPEAEAYLRAQYGLDKPLAVQYLTWLSKAIRGDLGTSWRFAEPVMDMFRKRVLLSFEIAGIAIFISVVGSITLGIYLAVHQNSAADQIIRFLGLIAVSAPIFWVALALILVLSQVFHWMPPVRYVSWSEDAWKHFQIVFVPAALWGVLSIPSFSRYVRNAVLDVLSADYVRTARSKGLHERRVLFVHALRNAAGPLVTVIGMSIGGAAGGNVLLENVFSLPGMGRLYTTAISQRDYPVVLGLSLLLSLFFLFMMLVTDLAYAWLDPRVRYE